MVLRNSTFTHESDGHMSAKVFGDIDHRGARSRRDHASTG
jgi:hypothetical protein